MSLLYFLKILQLSILIIFELSQIMYWLKFALEKKGVRKCLRDFFLHQIIIIIVIF